MSKEYYVYILTNYKNTTLYTGVTGDISARLWQHRIGTGGRFSSQYKTTKLV